MVLNPETGHSSTQLHMVFDDEFSTVPFMREDTILPNWTDLVYHISQIGAPYNIDLEDTWFTPYIEEYPSKTSTHVPRVAKENNRNITTSSQSIKQVQVSPIIKKAPS